MGLARSLNIWRIVLLRSHDQLDKWSETDKSKFNIKVGEMPH